MYISDKIFEQIIYHLKTIDQTTPCKKGVLQYAVLIFIILKYLNFGQLLFEFMFIELLLHPFP